MVEPRKSSLKKAPAVDVLDAITGVQPQPNVAAGISAETLPATESRPKKAAPTTTRATRATDEKPAVIVRRVGPGRPRGRRRMEPFSSKIEINLRDEVDEYITANDMTIVDFLDEAFRMRLDRK